MENGELCDTSLADCFNLHTLEVAHHLDRLAIDFVFSFKLRAQ